ncbi:MAG: magnesium chelatase ATPase subunit I, partial [Acidaminococcaceae bacterium]|nr:magnesium chelatase ATPase subunit I [Acidaminococcaceae bacterium]
ALAVTVTGEHDRDNRKEVIKRRLAYEADPEGFIASFKEQQEELADKIVAAGKLLPEVTVADAMLDKVADLAIDLGVDGHRSDITLIKTAMTMAAFRGSRAVETEDLKIAARLALPHRMRRRPFEDGTLDMEKVLAVLEG